MSGRQSSNVLEVHAWIEKRLMSGSRVVKYALAAFRCLVTGIVALPSALLLGSLIVEPGAVISAVVDHDVRTSSNCGGSVTGASQQANMVFGGVEENIMLKIDFSETPAEERWILHGRLTDPWVDEFKAYWKKNHRRDVARACIVDLNEVTFIDKCGERLLRMLARRGVQFTASGMYTKHILEQITRKT